MEINKKIPAIIFLAVYLFSANASRELLKLTALVEHYLVHVAANRDIAFGTYLIQHYYTEDGTDKDAAEDSQLPFKSPVNITLSFISLKPPPFLLTGDKAEVNFHRSFCIQNDRFPSSQYLNAIWQPPRLCFLFLS